MFKVEVIADSSGKWCGNALKFDTIEQAKDYASDLFARWTAVRQWRVVNEAGLVVLEPLRKHEEA